MPQVTNERPVKGEAMLHQAALWARLYCVSGVKFTQDIEFPEFSVSIQSSNTLNCQHSDATDLRLLNNKQDTPVLKP